MHPSRWDQILTAKYKASYRTGSTRSAHPALAPRDYPDMKALAKRMLALLALTVACSASAQVQVRLWSLLSGGDGARMQAIIRDFNSSQRDVKVTATTLNWGEPFYTKLITASVVGAGPDVATVHLSRIDNLAGGGVLRAIGAADLQHAGLDKEKFLQRQWDKANY